MNAQPQARARAAGEPACRPGSVTSGFLTCHDPSPMVLTCRHGSHYSPTFLTGARPLAEQRRNRRHAVRVSPAARRLDDNRTLEGCAAPSEAGTCLPLHLPMPCQRLAVKDAAGAAQRSKILDSEWHGYTLSRAARSSHTPRVSEASEMRPLKAGLIPPLNPLLASHS
jgi:hypothetical protein